MANENEAGMGGGAQRPVRRGNAPKKTGARARKRGQNPLVHSTRLILMAERQKRKKEKDYRYYKSIQKGGWALGGGVGGGVSAPCGIQTTDKKPAVGGLMIFLLLCCALLYYGMLH